MKENFSCGKRIKELRLERSLSQERVALNAGITPVYLGQIERGVKNATVLKIEQICHAMNISLAEFFSTATDADSVDDEIGKQILYQLTGLDDAEKTAVLQIIKSTLLLRQHALLYVKENQKH